MAEAGYVALALAAVAAAGTVYSSQQQANAADAEADQAEANANTARQQGAAAEDAQRRRNAQMLGVQRAAAAESGFDPNTGSLATLQVKSAGEAELDALTARYEGTMQGIGLEQQATSLRTGAKATRITGYTNAAGTLASAAGSYYGGSGGSYNYRGSTMPNSLRGGG